MESDAIYYSRRAREERQAACSANKQQVRDRHLEFAQAYEFRARFLLAEADDGRVIQNLPVAG